MQTLQGQVQTREAQVTHLQVFLTLELMTSQESPSLYIALFTGSTSGTGSGVGGQSG